MAYKFYSGPQGVVTVTSCVRDGPEITVAKIENRDLKGRWIMQIISVNEAEVDVTETIHDHAALSETVNKQLASIALGRPGLNGESAR